MRVRAKGSIKDMYDGRHYALMDGDQVTVPDDLGGLWVANGWAVNVETGEDNAPSRDPVTLAVHNASSKNNTGVNHG